MSKSLQRAAKRSAALLLVFLLVGGIAEIVLRLATDPPSYHDSAMPIDPELGFATAPHVDLVSHDEFGDFPFRTNALGFRGPDLPLGRPKPAGATRIVFVGDSFLHAWSVREELLMTEVLRERVARATGRAPEVYNLSCSDYGTAQELLLFRRYGEALQPDAVVLELFLGNDVIDNELALAGAWTPVKGDFLRPYLVPEPDGTFETHHVFPFLAFLRRHSRLFALAERRVLAGAVDRDLEWLEPYPHHPEPPDARLSRGLAPRVHYEILRTHPEGDPERERWEQAWKTTEALLCAFRDRCRAIGARFCVLVIPMHDQVQIEGLTMDHDLRSWLTNGRSIHELLQWDLPERRLGPFFEREGIEFGLLLDPLRAAAKSDPRLYVMDGHFSWRAHALAGALAADWFLGRAPLPTTVTSTGPTPLLEEPARAHAWLDFRAEPHRANLFWGFHDERVDAAGAAGTGLGWLTKDHASFVLPARTGDLLVRGFLPEEMPLPLHVWVEVYPLVTKPFELAEHGPFELRLASPIPADVLERFGTRYVPITLHLEHTYRCPLGDAGVILQEAGFASEELDLSLLPDPPR